MLVLNLRAFENKKYAVDDRFHGNGPYGGILTTKEPIRMLGFTLPYNNIPYPPGLFSFSIFFRFGRKKSIIAYLSIAGLSIVAVSFIPAGTENTGNKETISEHIIPT